MHGPMKVKSEQDVIYVQKNDIDIGYILVAVDL